LRLAKDGLDVAVNDIAGNPENVTAVSEKIAAMGRKTSVHIADVSVEDQVKKMIEGVVESHGGLDVVGSHFSLLREIENKTNLYIDGCECGHSPCEAYDGKLVSVTVALHNYIFSLTADLQLK